MATTDEQLAKLPAYARREIDKLRADVEYWRERATAGPEQSNTFVDNLGLNEDQPLGKSPRVRFQYGEGASEAISVRVSQDGCVLVEAGGLGSGAITAQPVASNVIRVRVHDWWNSR